MSPMRAATITALAITAHALLLPSCVQWNIGECIRERAETRVGADVTQRFLTSGDNPQLLAPEVTYRASTPLVALREDNDPTAHDIRPTGRLRAVSLPELSRRSYRIPHHFRTTVGELWVAEAPVACQQPPRLGYRVDAASARWLGCAERRREDSYPLRATLAAPFDYLVDPVLSAASSAVVLPVFLWLLLAAASYDTLMF